jgi:[acyl-carrier-protein] S-malonyltransferase
VTGVAATVGAITVGVDEIDRREAALRAGPLASALPRPGTSEGRQLRRWLTQLVVTQHVVAIEAASLGVTAEHAPAEDAVLPSESARLEIGSVAAAALADPLARALFARLTGDVEVPDGDVAGYHERNPLRFAVRSQTHGWRAAAEPPALDDVRQAIAAHLRGAARRRAFRVWLDARRAALVQLSSGYEHPGDPGQPDNTHRH